MGKLILSCLLIGAVAGLAGALCGVGGGIIMVPAFVLLLEMGQKTAVASSLAVVVVAGLSATANNMTSKPELIDWRIVGITAVGAVVAAWYGSDLMRSLSNQQLTRIFGVLMIVVGARMLMMK